MNAFETSKFTTYETALKAAEATNNGALTKLVKMAESTRIKMGISEDAWAELGEKLVKVCDNGSTTAGWLGAEVLKEAKAAVAEKRMCSSSWASVPMLHPKNPSLYGGVASSTATKYGTAEIDKHCLLACERMFRESWSEKSLDELLCFQINNNEDCFCFKAKDMVNVVTDAQAKLPMEKSFVYGCEPKNTMFLGRPLYGVAFCDPAIEKRKRTIYPPCLFSEAITTADVGGGGIENGGDCPYMDTNTYWFFDREKWFKFTALALGVEASVCDECGKAYAKKEGQEFVYRRAVGKYRVYVCCDCVQIAENKIRAEEEAAKSKYENAIRMAEPARATAEAELLKMLEDKEIIVAVKPVKAESAKERNKRLAAEAARELKAEKKRKEDYLKATGQYKSPEQIKKEKDARLKAEIAQMGKRK